MDNARHTAVKLLCDTFSKNGFSNIVLDNALKKSDMSKADKRFCTAVYYGVIERKITLDYIISHYTSKKTDDITANILRSGIYQIKYMDSVPDSAAVNESVKLACKMKRTSAKGFINAVLRNFIRDNKNIKYPDNTEDFPFLKMSVDYSVPIWLAEKLCLEYGVAETEAFLKESLEKPPVTVRMNNLRTDEENFFQKLGNIDAVKNNYLSCCYELKGGDITECEAFENGLFHIQDMASQLCCKALSPTETDTVIDICSAPGGKAFTLAEMMNGKGSILAFDLHQKRVNLIENGAKRLGLQNISARKGDASVYDESIPKADKILCDVPCSGLGVIRRKPEIKYKNPDDFKDLPNIQYAILENASKYLKAGGEIVYSTCTLSRSENDNVVERFLENHTDFEGVNLSLGQGENESFKLTLMSGTKDFDGFFIAKLKKKI